MKHLLCTAILLLGLTTTSYGADGSSGCGPGWYVLKKNSLISSIGRIITNGILTPVVTLGMTFGTSNCSKHSIVLKDKRPLHFASHNMEHLRHEIAQGNGEFLTAYLASFGCHIFSHEKIKSSLRDHLEQLLHTPHAQVQALELVSLTTDLIVNSKTLYSSCMNLS